MQEIFKMKNDMIYPHIWQGGMGAGISLESLASAVARHGGFGTISSVALDIFVEKKTGQKINMLEATKKETGDTLKKAYNYSQNIGINIMCKLRNMKEIIQGAISGGCQNLICGAGLPLELPKAVDDAIKYLYSINNLPSKIINDFKTNSKNLLDHNINLIPIISSGVMFNKLCQYWKDNFDCLPDAVICEGPLAGGHIAWNTHKIKRWGKNFFEKFDVLGKLLPEMRSVAKKFLKPNGNPIPVIVVGGFYDKAGIEKALNYGASAVQLGTRFLLSEESGASDEYKKTILDTSFDQVDIATDNILSPCDFTFSRSILSPIYKHWEEKSKSKYFCICVSLLKAAGITLKENCEAIHCPYGYVNSEKQCLAHNNVIKEAIFTCGKIAEKITNILPVKKIIENLL